MTVRLRRALCLVIVLCFLFSPAYAVCAFALSETKATIIETNIGIQPSDYKKMIATKAENRFYVNVAADNASVHRAKIHIRGCASKELGFASPTKRLPIELVFTDASEFSDQIGNTHVEFSSAPVPCQLLSQYLAYEMFAFLDIPTPAHTFAFIQYNDIDFGLYHVLENVNQRFLEKNFSAPFGSLYKGAESSEKHAYSSSRWFGDLKEIEDHGSERIEALLHALECENGYEEYINVDEFLRFFACTAACGGYNSILDELTSFFLYDDNGKFILIPWDNSDAFLADETGNGIDHFRLEFWDDAPPAELFDLLMKNPENRELYHGYIRQINEHFLAPEVIDPLYQSLAFLIKPYLLRDHTIYINNPYDLPIVPEENGYGSLETFLFTLHQYHDNLEAQLNGSEDTFYRNTGPDPFPSINEMSQLIDYLVQISPTVDTDITKKICVGYSAYCRNRGISHFATGDPAEYTIAFILFAIVFGVVLFCVWRPSERSDRRKKTCRSKSRRS